MSSALRGQLLKTALETSRVITITYCIEIITEYPVENADREHSLSTLSWGGMSAKEAVEKM